MDAKTLAERLGVAPKTIHTRARSLGIAGTQTKSEGREGRPSIVFSPEECELIANFGKSQKPVSDGDMDNKAAATGGMILRNIAQPLAQSFQAVNQHLEALEDTGAEVLAQRIQAMPSRMMMKAAAKLQTYEHFDFSEVFGVLTVPSLPVTTIEVNLGSPLPRQDTLKPAS